ncbi:TIGR04282 family arsenosugar biosynthesis glycosyltransferase [Algoriphagus jejuensis]|uniref:TIGR04282 family arsenosugar biosynthesis glycosyltransferase n=2 Tax=Algoriphagus jejuensis TaxID=419934 RepID=A0ABP3YE83_9BACT
MKAGLIIFQKNAIRGHVKTRLATSVGDDHALEIYNWLTTYTHQIAQQVKVDRYLFYSDFVPELAEDCKNDYQFELQSGSNLGDRMHNAFKKLFENGYSNVVIIGTDCADLEISDLNDAYMALSHSDLVIGPANDGGYYLLGMSGYHPEVFDEIPWSTSKVLELTLDIANKLGLDYEFLNIRSDIDTFEDWQNFTFRKKIKHVEIPKYF